MQEQTKVPVMPEDFPEIPAERMMEVWEKLDNAKKDWVLNTAEFMVNSQEFGANVTEFIDTSASRFKGLFGGKKES